MHDASTNSKAISEELVSLWQTATGQSVTVPDAESMSRNIAGFFKLLAQWDSGTSFRGPEQRFEIPSPEQRCFDEAGQFIHDFAEWRYWVTLTFRREVSERRARAALDWWLRVVARDVIRDHVTCAWAMSLQDFGAWHFHILLGWRWDTVIFNGELGVSLWQKADPLAGVREALEVEEYDPEQGAAWYLVKHDHWEPPRVVCPQLYDCARGGCSNRTHT